MHPTRPEIQVEVHKLRNRYVAVTKDELGQEILRNEFQYATTHLTYLGPPWLIDQNRLVPEEQGRLGRIFKETGSRAQVSLKGWNLFQYLFGDGRSLSRHIAELRDAQARSDSPSDASSDATAAALAQLTLSFSPGAASLGRLPWEYIFDGKRFPCLEGELMISRRPLDVAPLPIKLTAGPLRVLVVLPAPTDQVKFEIEKELSALQDALAPLIQARAVVMHLLPEPTPSAMLEAIRAECYDVVHYVGHGSYHLPQHQGYLCFEDELGRSALVSGIQLPRFAHVDRSRTAGEEHQPSTPRLFVISACRNAQVGVFDAFQSVAQDLLHRGFPAVLTIPSGLRSASACAFYRALYRDVAEGETVLAGLRQGRWALRDIDRQMARSADGPNSGTTKRRFDWGLPVLHQRAPALALIRQGATAFDSFEPQEQRLISRRVVLAGRHRQIQSVRKGLDAGARIFYILGGDGVGKHAFASYLLDHLGAKPATYLRMDCREMLEPLSVLAQIADFWRSEVSQDRLGADAARAAELLLDSHEPPRERAQQAQRLVRKRTVILMENVDALFAPAPTPSGELASPLLQEIILGLMSEPSRTVYVITGRRRWAALAEIPTADQREIRLPLLTERYAVQLMYQLPALRREASSREQKWEIYRLVGGHPLILTYVDRWLAFGHTLDALADMAPKDPSATEVWLATLTEQLLDQLDPGEYQVLRALSILELPFDTDTIGGLTQVTPKHARPLIEGWLHLGVIAPALRSGKEGTAYNLVQPVRQCLLERLSASEAEALHRQAAHHYGAPYLDAARRQVLARTITTWSEERIGWLARDANGILGLRLRRQENTKQKAALIEAALAWRHHLLQIGASEAAAQIVQTVAPDLNQLGQRDLSRKLIREALPSTAAPDQQLDTLTQLRLEEGPLTAALQVYQEVYRSLDPETEIIQRTYVMLRAGHVHQQLGNLSEALEHYRTALRIIRKRESREPDTALTTEEAMTAEADTTSDHTCELTDSVDGRWAETADSGLAPDEVLTAEAECLARLASAYREAETLREALVCSQAAKEHYQTLENAMGQAALEHEQGLILKLMGRTESALERFIASLRLCREIGDQQCMADNLTEIGRLFDQLGKTDMAIQVVEEAIEHYAYLRSPDHGKVLALLEELYVKQKRMTDAITRFRTTKGTIR